MRTINRIHSMPLQFLTDKQKIKEFGSVKEHIAATARYYNDCRLDNTVFGNRQQQREWFRAFGTDIRNHQYNDVFNSEEDNQEIPHYDILRNPILTLIGEFINIPKKPIVNVLNNDVKNKFTETLEEVKSEILLQTFYNMLAEKGMVDKSKVEEVPPPERVADKIAKSWRDNRAIKGQKALNHIFEDQNVFKKLNNLYFSYNVGGDCVSYKTIIGNKIVYQKRNILNTFVFGRKEYIQDSEAVVYTSLMSMSELLYEYPELEQKVINDIETDSSYSDLIPDPINATIDLGDSGVSTDNDAGLPDNVRNVHRSHVVYKGKKWVGFLSYPNILGQMVTRIVDGDFELDEEAIENSWVLEKEFVNTIFEATIINNKWVVDERECLIQQRDYENPNDVKLPYNGVQYGTENSENISLLSIGLNIQKFYNVVFKRWKKSIRKLRDTLALIDNRLKPDGWDEQDWWDYAEETDILQVDWSKVKNMPPTQQNVIRLGYDSVKQYSEIISTLKVVWDEICGISLPRRGQTQASQNATNINNAVQNSVNVTAYTLHKFLDFIKVEYEGLLELSKKWENGYVAQYTTPDKTTDFLEVDEDYKDSMFGIFMGDPIREFKKLEESKAIIDRIAQKGVSKDSTILEMIHTDNIVELLAKIRKEEANEQQMNQAAQEKDLKLEEEKRRVDVEKFEKELEYKYYKTDVDNNTKILISENSSNADIDNDGDLDIDDALNRQKIINEARKLSQMDRKLDIEERKRLDQKEKFNKELAIKKKMGTGI